MRFIGLTIAINELSVYLYPNFRYKNIPKSIAGSMEPPLLTDRQYEILKLMADGYTRQEIAAALNLSPETVKSHSKTVLAKFGVKTFREAYADIHDYLRHYSLGQTKGRHYWARLHRSLTIAHDYNSAYLQHYAQGYVVRGAVSEYLVRLRSPWCPRNVLINGSPPTRTDFSGEIRSFFLDIDPPLGQGAPIVRHSSYIIQEPPSVRFTFTAEQIVSPVGEMVMVTKFPSTPPDNIRVSVLNEAGRVDIRDRHPDCKVEIGQITVVTVENPEYGARYMVHWDPVTIND